jgi:hypothetical protein
MTTPTSTTALTDPADRFNQLAPDLPLLFWTVDDYEVRGMVDPDADNAEASEVLTLWADRLNLTLIENGLAGAREYAGTHGEQKLVVWGVTDRVRWAEDTRRAVEAYWGWPG